MIRYTALPLWQAGEGQERYAQKDRMMKGKQNLFLVTLLVVLIVACAYLFIDHTSDSGTPGNGTAIPSLVTGDVAEPPAKDRALPRITQAEDPDSPRSTEELYAKMNERYGGHYAVHNMNPRDIGEGEHIHLGLYLVKGQTKHELGVTSLSERSYHNKVLVAVSIGNGKARIERWGTDGYYTGNAWTLSDEVRRQCESVKWRDARPEFQIGDTGHTDVLGIAGDGWNLMVECWKYKLIRKSA